MKFINIFKVSPNYAQARMILDSHIQYLDEVSRKYQEGSELISYSELAKLPYYQLMDAGNISFTKVAENSVKLFLTAFSDKGGSIPRQWHDTDKKLILLHGKAVVRLVNGAEEVHVLAKGDSIELKGGMVHTLELGENSIMMAEIMRGSECL